MAFVFLGECTKYDSCDCVLNRTCNPHYRNAFEEKVSSSIISKINSSDNAVVTYTGFGTGGAYQDFVILLKTLVQKPTAKLNIHLIEGDNSGYVMMADRIKNDREVKHDNGIDFENNKLLNNYAQFLRNKYPDDPSITKITDDEALKLNIVDEMFCVEAKYKQFILTLSKIFPRAQLSLTIHDQTDSYLQYLNEKNLPHADVVCTADIQDEMSLIHQSINNYAKLCVKTLQHKPDSHNIWLALAENRQDIYLTTLSLQEQKGSHKNTINIDNKDMQCYSTENKL